MIAWCLLLAVAVIAGVMANVCLWRHALAVMEAATDREDGPEVLS